MRTVMGHGLVDPRDWHVPLTQALRRLMTRNGVNVVLSVGGAKLWVWRLARPARPVSVSPLQSKPRPSIHPFLPLLATHTQPNVAPSGLPPIRQPTADLPLSHLSPSIAPRATEHAFFVCRLSRVSSLRRGSLSFAFAALLSQARFGPRP
jgi:hypothetical protein